MQIHAAIYNIKLVFVSLGKANFLHSKSSSLWLLWYLLAGFAIFGGCAFFGLKYQHVMYQAVLDYIFPSSWQRVADIIVDFFFESQSKLVLAGLISSGSLVVASLVLFPIKEKCSEVYEQALGLPNGRGEELPLWMQGVEELKLLWLYLTVQMVILAIGYYPYAAAKISAEILSILFLAFTFSIDFIAPTLQRHGIKYNNIIRLLLGRFFTAVVWGAVFALPVLYMGKFLLVYSELTLIEVSALIFALNLFFLALAIASGTYLASALLPQAKQIAPLTPHLKKSAYYTMTLLFLAGIIFHGSILMSVHHKSQILKMEYSINWSEVDVEMDSFMALVRDEGDVAIAFPLQVTNPTSYDFELEDSIITLRQENRDIAKMAVSHLQVAAGAQVTRNMRANIRVSGKSLSGFRKLMSGWNAYLTYDVLPGLPLIIQIM